MIPALAAISAALSMLAMMLVAWASVTATSSLDSTKKDTVTITVKTKEIDSSKLVAY